MYPTDGRKVFDIYAQPLSLRDSIKKDLGDFPFPHFGAQLPVRLPPIGSRNLQSGLRNIISQTLTSSTFRI